MSSTVKGTIIITNHFTRDPVLPKIVYANKYLLDFLGTTLETVVGQDPGDIFLNWKRDDFIKQIVTCVENKQNWQGIVDLSIQGIKHRKNFLITPVFDSGNEISYYSCSTEVPDTFITFEHENLFVLDNFIACLQSSQEHFKEVCDTTPNNLINIDMQGTVVYANNSAIESLGLNVGDNLWAATSESKSLQDEFSVRAEKGRVRQTQLEVIAKGKMIAWDCKYWPTTDSQDSITGYALSLTNNTRNYHIAKQFEALKG